MNDLRIWISLPKNRRYWVIRWQDPETQQVRERTTGTTKKKDAERLAGELRADILSRRFVPTQRVAWEAFRNRYEQDVVPTMAKKTGSKIATAFNAIEEILSPGYLNELTAERLSYFQSKLRERLADTTVASYLAHLKSALRWSVDMGMIPAVPRVARSKRVKASRVMKGRPINDTEFQAMLKEIPNVVPAADVAAWKYYLRGLWTSGLRLEESLNLFWDDDGKLLVTFQDDEIFLKIPAELEKGNKDRLLPIAPEFQELLLETPIEHRVGRVFKLPSQRGGQPLCYYRVSEIVREIGEKAKVLVNNTKNKFASAHDLRRSFGERWSARVMPQVLMELMRHESIETTLKFYVGQDAKRTARLVREAYEMIKKRKS